MGVRGFSRWLQRKYPDIIQQCVDKSEGGLYSVNIMQSNPNGIEFDNLYLDMNDIIHLSAECDNQHISKTEDDIIEMIFQYIDRIFSIIRPHKLLYMAIDGVAPRAKLNQQRCRCFRNAQNNSANSESFNKCHIQPGTSFMSKLSNYLRDYIYHRMNTNSAWQSIKVILSDSNVPGEGEHKIFDFIRAQSDLNTYSVVYGNDSDLILLGLTLHKTYNIKILCEDFRSDNNQRKKYTFIDLKILRRNLENELKINPSSPAPQWNRDRAIDDWVLMCFLGGNDFLPNIPSIEFYENVMDILTDIYKHDVLKSHGYLTDNAQLNRNHLKILLKYFSEKENNIFQKRPKTNVSNNIQTLIKLDKPPIDMNQVKESNAKPMSLFTPPWLNKNFTSTIPKPTETSMQSPKMKIYEPLTRDQRSSQIEDETSKSSISNRQEQIDSKEENIDPNDTVRLGEEGWHERYYKQKFNIDVNTLENFRTQIVQDYVQGLCWILEYYYKGVPSWDWYYSYHYAPFASDFTTLKDTFVPFNKNSKPLKPLEQLIAIYPPKYAKYLPERWQELIFNKESRIFNFYPANLDVDLNGKLKKEQGIIVLPFIDEKLLLQTLESVYETLTPEEEKRNKHDYDVLFIHSTNSCYKQFKELYYHNDEHQITQTKPLLILTNLSEGMTGRISADDDDEFKFIGETIQFRKLIYGNDIKHNQVLSVKYQNS